MDENYQMAAGKWIVELHLFFNFTDEDNDTNDCDVEGVVLFKKMF